MSRGFSGKRQIMSKQTETHKLFFSKENGQQFTQFCYGMKDLKSCISEILKDGYDSITIKKLRK